ncbi:MAG: putative glycosyltransferase, exosortase G system-associated [Clostridia bacterium]|nr:putative glycosyltransferase, exosortase G system-associated [Clostridia bacterium]
MSWLTEFIRNGLIIVATVSWIRAFIGSSIAFWMAWIIIPLVMEIIPAISNFFVLLNKKRKNRKEFPPLKYEPEISLIIPVYNSQESLYRCIKSIRDSDYPPQCMSLIISNNESKDQSFEIFKQCQNEFPELMMSWTNAKQGKSKALNLALFNSSSKYIIHMDSDGILHPEALRKFVEMFEADLSVDCATGNVVVNPEMIEETKGFFKRFIRRLEFFEYCQAFLAGRSFQAEFNVIYTMSGAFSAFRKSSILKTQLYNTDTVSEDTHLTFQLRQTLKSKVEICERAVFFVDPIEDLNTLYTQRQRWQRGEIEVIHMFMSDQLTVVKGFATSFVLRILFYDHTFAFPRMIWYFALLCLAFLNYPMRLIVISVILIYILYVLSGLLYYFNIRLFLKSLEELRKYYTKKWYLVFFLPLFNFLVFWFRFAGIINSISGKQMWKAMNLSQEKALVREIIYKDMKRWIDFKRKIDLLLNNYNR